MSKESTAVQKYGEKQYVTDKGEVVLCIKRTGSSRSVAEGC